MQAIKDWLHKLLTGKDNETPDLIRVGGVFTFLQGMGLTFYDVLVSGHAFNLQEFGIGAGVLFGAIGAALGLKKGTEPHE